MTSDTDRPRQRTVAELLAEHGDNAAAPRRRRRRAPEDDIPADDTTASADEGSPPLVAQRTASPPANPDAGPDAYPDSTSHPYFEPGDNDRREAYGAVSRPGAFAEPAPAPAVPQRAARGEFPTDVMPRVPAAQPGYADDAEATGPIPLVGPGHDTGPLGAGPVADGGPPTQFSPGVVDDDEGGADQEWSGDWSDDDEWVDEDERGAVDAPTDTDDADGEYAERHGDDGVDGDDYDDDEDDRAPAGLRERAQPAGGPSWPAVIAQWIAGAVGGAALWVAFRYLWNSFPVVAVAGALLVTIGLVVIVRALLRNNDLRTTIFAVLVGLLLTASPAILVLIGR